MALIKCTECGKEFSEFAEKCPECSCPTSIIKSNSASAYRSATPGKNEPANINQYTNNTPEKKGGNGLYYIIIALLVLLVIGAALAIFLVNETKNKNIEHQIALIQESQSKPDTTVVAAPTQEVQASQLEKKEEKKEVKKEPRYHEGNYTSKGKNLRIRTSPNFGHNNFVGNNCYGGVAYLQRGDRVYSDGQYRNGFLHVYEGGSDGGCWDHSDGWVYASYLR